MKRFLTYCLLTAAFLVGMAGVGAQIRQQDPASVHTRHEASVPGQDDYVFRMADGAFMPAGVTRVEPLRPSSPTAKEETNLYHLQCGCFSQLTLLLLCTTRRSYRAHYAQRRKAGYYLYSLRKLLI